MFEEVYGPELMQEFHHDEWDTYMKRCVHGPTYHETVPCGAVFRWQRRDFGLEEFCSSKTPPPQWQFTAPVNYTPMEADIYRVWCITTHTRSAFDAPSCMVGLVVLDPAIPWSRYPARTSWVRRPLADESQCTRRSCART